MYLLHFLKIYMEYLAPSKQDRLFIFQVALAGL